MIKPLFSSLLATALLPILPSPAMNVASRKPLQDRIEEIHLTSAALGRTVPITVVRPAGTPPAGGWPILFVLHGHGRNNLTLLQNPETLSLVLAQPYLIVMPDTGDGWWVDAPADPTSRYDAMLLEVMDWTARTYPVAPSPTGWGISGWSMGGFGAMHFAERHPDRISFVGTVIGLLDFPRIEGLPEGQRYGVPEAVFGKDEATWNADNPSRDVAALRGKRLVIVVADQGFDRTMNENFLAAAAAIGLQPRVFHIEGEHVFQSVIQGFSLVFPEAARHFSNPTP